MYQRWAIRKSSPQSYVRFALFKIEPVCIAGNKKNGFMQNVNYPNIKLKRNIKIILIRILNSVILDSPWKSWKLAFGCGYSPWVVKRSRRRLSLGQRGPSRSRWDFLRSHESLWSIETHPEVTAILGLYRLNLELCKLTLLSEMITLE